MAYVNFNRGLTRAQIEALTNAVNGKIYFATDGGIYVGKADGTAEEKADINYRTESKTGQEFVYRKSPATIKAKSLTLDRIYGKTLVWNQILENGNFAVAAGWYPNSAAISIADNVITITPNDAAQSRSAYHACKEGIVNHKYYLALDMKASTQLRCGVGYAGTFKTDIFTVTTAWSKYSTILNGTDSDQFVLIYCIATAVGDNVQARNFVIIDLTAMFGEGKEPTTVEEFEALFPLPYYEYNAGTLISNDASAIETVGFNLWDEEWESGYIDITTGQNMANSNTFRPKGFIPIINGQTYYIKQSYGSMYILCYDVNKNYLGEAQRLYRSGVVSNIRNNTAYIRFYFEPNVPANTTYNHDICINLSDPAKNGTYEPYRKTTLQLGLNNFKVKDGNGNITTITGGLKSAGSVRDEIVGNKYIKRVGSVDLGTMNWTYTQSSGRNIFSNPLADAKHPSSGSILANILCAKYNLTTDSSTWADKDYSMGTVNLNIVDNNFQSAATFKTAMDGVYLDYELATPIEYEIVEPLVYSMAAGTTEERISPNSDGLSAPFCCDMTYDANANNDSANAQYALTAGRLYNTHKLWGRDFDGSNDVSGALSGVTTIEASGNITAQSFVKNGGTSSQFLKADGSVDSNTYALNSNLAWNKTQQGGAILVNSGATASASGAIAYGEANISDIIASGTGSQAGGYAYGGLMQASGYGSAARGCAVNEGGILSSGYGSNAQGYCTDLESYIDASGAGSFVNGYVKSMGMIQATNEGAFVNGYANYGTINATNKGAVALGYVDGDVTIKASGLGSFAQGYADGDSGNITASGKGSHAEGTSTTASGDYSHAEGDSTTASGIGAHAEGLLTSAINDYEHAEGKYNASHKKTTGTAAEQAAGSTLSSVGCGTGANDRKNAVEVMQNGDVYIYGLGGYDGTNAGASGVKTVQTVINELTTALNG